MVPYLALLLSFAALVVLLRFDPGKEPGVSPSLWVPLALMFIAGSRLPSQWVGGSTGFSAQSLADGNLLDATIFALLMLIAFAILVSRRFSWEKFFAANVVLTILLCFALLSVLWSDFPFVTFRRWVRALGTYLAILVVLSDPGGPFEATRSLLRRLGFLLVPLCIVLNKYFPGISKEYHYWTGQAYYVGATTSKNMLGVVCLVSGLFFFWDTLARWRNRGHGREKWIIGVNVAFFFMTLWLLAAAGSATSTVCLVVGCMVLAAAHSKPVIRNPGLLTVPIPALILLYLLLQFGFGINFMASLSEAVGRNPDLTGRTNMWPILLNASANPVVGAGYESFWVGPRLEALWSAVGLVNQAHNGYLEVYLNLGLIGLFLFVLFLIATYWTICRKLRASTGLGSLSLAFWIVLIFYNVTESAGLNGHFLWLVFLLGAIAVPGAMKRSYSRTRSLPYGHIAANRT